jgi:hypothetical protein
MALTALTAWLEQQGCAAESYELIIIEDRTTRDLARTITSKLRCWDQVLEHNGNSRAQFHAGANRARGRVIFFTESHAIPEPRTLANARMILEDERVDGFMGHVYSSWTNAVGHAEAARFDLDSAIWSHRDHWAKCGMFALAIRRDSYESVGGLETRYAEFAEHHLAAKLKVSGARKIYAPSVALEHRVLSSLSDLDRAVRRYITGESLFRLSTSPLTPERQLFPAPPEWTQTLVERNRPAGSVVAPLARRLASDRDVLASPLDRSESLRQLGNWLSHGRAMGHLRLVRAWLVAAAARLRFSSARTQHERDAAYASYHDALARAWRIRLALHDGRRLPSYQGCSYIYPIETLDERALWGFSRQEQHEGLPFRWTAPFSAISVRLKGGAYRGAIQLARIRRPPDGAVAIFAGRRRIQPLIFDSSTWTLSFGLRSRRGGGIRPLCLSIHVPAWDASTGPDSRALGLPIRGLSFEPIHRCSTGGAR